MMLSTETKTRDTKVAWLTDLHLDHLDSDQRDKFFKEVSELDIDAILLGGDIGKANSVVRYLEQLASAVRKPIFFVLGNHDYYHGSMKEVRQQINWLVGDHQYLRWLPNHGPIALSHDTGLLGHGGWADGRLGDYANSNIDINDYVLIKELSGISRMTRLLRMQELATEAVEYFRKQLPLALATYKHVYVLTHVPPFQCACWHEGKICDDDWIPHFGSKVIGDELVKIMAEFPKHKLTVLCGHTHSSGESTVGDSIEIMTGEATYGEPEIQEVFELVNRERV